MDNGTEVLRLGGLQERPFLPLHPTSVPIYVLPKGRWFLLREGGDKQSDDRFLDGLLSTL